MGHLANIHCRVRAPTKNPAKTTNRPRRNVRPFILPSYLVSIFCKSSPSPFLLCNSNARSIPRWASKVCEGNGDRYDVHSSALIDGGFWLHIGSARTVAAHVAIELTGQHHRHSCAVQRCWPQARYRASRLSGLYHSVTAGADLLSALRDVSARVLCSDHDLATLRRCNLAAFHAARSCSFIDGSPT